MTSRCALADFAFAGAAFGLSRGHGHAGAVNGDAKHVRQRRGRRAGHHLPGADRLRLRGDGCVWLRRRRLRGPLDPLVVKAIPASSASRPPALANGTAAAARRSSPQTRRHRGLPDAESGVPGRDPVPALHRSDTRPGGGDRPQHGVDGLVPVGHKLRQVASSALHRALRWPGRRPAVDPARWRRAWPCAARIASSAASRASRRRPATRRALPGPPRRLRVLTLGCRRGTLA